MNCSKLLSYMEKNEDSFINHAISSPTAGTFLTSQSTRNVAHTHRLADITAAQHTEAYTLQALEKWFTSQVGE